ncbi:SDR family oxidoreductase [Vibrio genomosp. F10]|uniref:Beta-ketoacyl-ACP reductase n=2 Tax=Vibrio genomosp. F10 TaxID=723171 RepID=A0A1B9R1R6_9VIBR|nr:SDR family oxidoreductase [Vibrio genomosp. F10]OCH78142.1 beta-ketoacyl-ACP reductase [Vibrio genomosp. F10]OEE31367.1 beta-ketoacyl-ACP reductase [Vibrio genomosp. F10 str. ZF-129]OEE96463.1 beta-ketoacyl-ACP reductase [Vibrio genomosp. F10 str. 9ZC157]OEE96888.1 beta-ketoacyl-ACP reductase [Vibrio genomosp. F10 str. 9ZD137]OEF10582.1 beta-ketoacyl-ACP reductase [Vibrio genomosp. F10 str. 9ZB36]
MKKLALITGSKGGIGSAISSKLVSDGYRVIATYYTGNHQCALDWFVEKEFNDDQVRLFELDVTNAAECAERLSNLLQEEGTIDVLVNNAGITKDSVFKKMTLDAWRDVIETNLNSLFNVTQPLFAPMCEKGSGRVINISSVNGLKGQFGQTNYSAAKAGMIGFSKALAAEGARSGVTVNVVAPGYTATPMVQQMKPEVLESIKSQIPMKRLATPEEIAESVSFLASDAGAYITGETLSVNGGLYMS